VADFRKLHVWRKAHAMALSAHRVCGKIRSREHSTLKTQLIRAAMSVPANIVEGRAQKTDREFARFLRIALGSATELEYHLIIGNDIGAIAQQDFQSLLAEVVDTKKMLTGLLNRLDPEKAPSAPKQTAQ
jgi:four helix bundle protein